MHCIQDYAINYQAYLLMLVMANGVTSLNTMMGLFGMGVHSTSHHEWTYIDNELGKAEQKSPRQFKPKTYKLKLQPLWQGGWHCNSWTKNHFSLSLLYNQFCIKFFIHHPNCIHPGLPIHPGEQYFLTFHQLSTTNESNHLATLPLSIAAT